MCIAPAVRTEEPCCISRIYYNRCHVNLSIGGTGELSIGATSFHTSALERRSRPGDRSHNLNETALSGATKEAILLRFFFTFVVMNFKIISGIMKGNGRSQILEKVLVHGSR
jgi:hypothetical protein